MREGAAVNEVRRSLFAFTYDATTKPFNTRQPNASSSKPVFVRA